MKIVLASSSPRRKMLLEQLNLKFDVMISDIEEVFDSKLEPIKVAESLAYQKAYHITKTIKGDCLVIGCDTIVVIENEILGKPENEQQVFDMLHKLSGKKHQVITGLCIIDTNNGEKLVEADISSIKFREIEDTEIAAYIKSGEPFDKAGAYAIQGLGSVFVESIEGSYSGIVGLPIFRLDRMLKHFGVTVLGK